MQEVGKDKVYDYLSTLYKNGQIAETYQVFTDNTAIRAIVITAGPDALKEKYHAIYSKNDKSILDENFNIELILVGISTDYSELCHCNKANYYILKTDYSGELTPVVCENCNGRVPLYSFPYINNEDEHFSTVSWMRAYESMDHLFMHCLCDRFTYRQLHKPESQLSIEGIEIAKAFEKNTQIPFYYYLMNYYKSSKNCPSCKQNWETDHPYFDYKCDVCRLVADRTNYDK